MNKLDQLFKKVLAHYGVKLFCLLSALFLWFYVTTDNDYSQVVSLPLKLLNQPQGWILSQSLPPKVKVYFQGSGKDLLSLGYRDKRVVLDIKNDYRTATFPISMDMIEGIPPDLKVTPIEVVDPQSIAVRWDRFAEKKVPVQSNIVLLPRDGYTQVGSIAFKPDSVLVGGPESLVMLIHHVTTQEKVYKDVIKAIKGNINLNPSLEETIRFALDEVEFQTEFQRIGEDQFTDISVTVTHVPEGWRVTVVPSTLGLKLQGGVGILSDLKKEDVIASIDFRTRTRYHGKRIPAKINVPVGITFSDVKPISFELIIER